MPGKSRALQQEEDERALQGVGSEARYSPRFCPRATDACLLGATNDDLARVFGVSLSSIERWLVEFPRFKRAVSEGREMADERVARSLYKRATGMRVKKQKAFNVNGGLQTIEVKEELPPDVNAASLWLSNRQRGKWRAANAGSDAGPTFDLGSFVQQIGQAIVQAQARPGDDAKPVDILDTVSTEPKG